VLFHLGLLVALLALISPVGYWAQKFVWVRSVQDLLLAVVAPALVVLGAPWLALRRGLERGLRHRRREPEGAVIVPEQAPGWLRLPIAVTVGFNVAWCGWHLPFLYDAAQAQPVVFGCEVITYLGLGVLFWLQLIGSWPHVPRLAPLRRVMLVVGTAVAGTGLAMVLVFGSAVLYPSYRGSQHHVLTLVADQQVGGAALWVIMLVPYSVAMVALLIRWLTHEESAALATGLDRLLKPAKPAWPSRPGLR
jgi:cytochrome c oxidase assembly factor CtaG